MLYLQSISAFSMFLLAGIVVGCTALPIDPAHLAPDPNQLLESPTRARQSLLLRQWMANPAVVPMLLQPIEVDIASAVGSPSRLLAAVVALGARAGDGVASSNPVQTEPDNLWPHDPLAHALQDLSNLRTPSANMPLPLEAHTELPDPSALPEPLRTEIAHMVAAIARAEQLRRSAFARLPASTTPAALIGQLLDTESTADEATELRALLPLVNRSALAEGMQIVVHAAERLDAFLASATALPRLLWTTDTPLGSIVVDTTGASTHRQLPTPLLLVDLGGDDNYLFLNRPAAQHISVLLDHGGNDRYTANAPAADPSAAVLGYGVLIDGGAGDDQYHATSFAQASAVLGAALLLDRGGDNMFTATAFSQAFALGGWAALQAGDGQDTFHAITHAQGAAAPEGAALLVNTAGDDHYLLANEPLLRPSPQLPDRNASMGQGAGRGWRPDASGKALSATGGVGVLFDLAGSDTYAAQVFAQGVGYHEGVGLLIDRGGDDQFNAAWYAMGAAAHDAVGVLVKRGTGNDRYRASHLMAMGAGHDFSVAVFLDEAGDDDYDLGNLGLGAAHNNSVALFTDGAGDDSYAVRGSPCRAFGTAHITEPSPARATLTNAATFVDRAGRNHFPSQCRPTPP